MDGSLVSSSVDDGFRDLEFLKSLNRLSTIFVANIEEVKERVSQIEFVFCDQLFPAFQSTTKSLQRKLVNGRKAAEDEWKEKECALLQEIEALRAERQDCRVEIQRLCSSLEESKSSLLSAEQLAKKYELEKESLVDKVESLTRNENIVGELKMQLEQKVSELSEAKELQKRLLEGAQSNDEKLLIEQAKTRDWIERFKQLKSQYLYLLRKVEDSTGSEHHFDGVHEVKNSPKSHPKKRSLQDSEEEEEEEITSIASQADELKMESCSHKNHEVYQDLQVVQRLNNVGTRASSSRLSLPKHTAATAKSEPSARAKKASLSWRETRAQETRGCDPHDDFLDTPLEVVRNLNKFPCQEAQDIAVPSQDMDFGNSDDETQDVNNKTIPEQQRISIMGPANKGFKYVEPVRKKAERENLKGVECQQCKKFYDAVLPGADNNQNQMSRRCEHHDAVSRHRYRCAPPMTPEGFWNIGFDSDM